METEVWTENIKLDFDGYMDVNCIHVVQGRDKKQALVITVTNFRVPQSTADVSRSEYQFLKTDYATWQLLHDNVAFVTSITTIKHMKHIHEHTLKLHSSRKCSVAF